MKKKDAINAAKNLARLSNKDYVVVRTGGGYCPLPSHCLKGKEVVVWRND